MKKREIVSIFIVTEYKTGNKWEETPIGMGQVAIEKTRKKYPRFTKFVLDGFEIDGEYVPADLRTYNRL